MQRLYLKDVLFSQNRTDSLGRVIKLGRLQVIYHVTDEVRKVRTPDTVIGLRPVLGLWNVFRRLVPNFG